MIITNIETIPGYTIKAYVGFVQGSTVRAKHVGTDILAGIKNIFGGELRGYSDLLENARKEAIERMKAEALSINADAVVNVRLSTSTITAGAAEILAYGTAVVIEKNLHD